MKVPGEGEGDAEAEGLRSDFLPTLVLGNSERIQNWSLSGHTEMERDATADSGTDPEMSRLQPVASSETMTLPEARPAWPSEQRSYRPRQIEKA